jgi:hypothetical protein
MNSQTDDPVSDKVRLLFGSGFAFGVVFTLVVLGIVAAGLGGGEGRLGVSVTLLVAVSVFLITVIGSATYLLAFPENRVLVPASIGPDDDSNYK